MLWSVISCVSHASKQSALKEYDIDIQQRDAISDFVDSYKTLPLETTKDNLIGNINKVQIIDTCIGNAAYFYSRIKDDSDFCTPVCPELSSVVFCLNRDDEVNRKVRRALLCEGTVIGQTVMNGHVMLKFTLLNPRLTHEHIDRLIGKIREYGGR